MNFAYKSTNRLPLQFRMEHMPVFFSDEQCLEVIHLVLDADGCIRNYPGIVEDERWMEKQRVALCPDVRYEAHFYSMENAEYLMLWLVQPSGWYWVDEDGFGFTGDDSIMLYSVLDQKGNFLKKFELFDIDGTRYCHEFDKYMR